MRITDKIVDDAISKACEFGWFPTYADEKEFDLIVTQMRHVLEAAQHGVQRIGLRCVSCEKPIKDEGYCCDCVDEIAANR